MQIVENLCRIRGTIVEDHEADWVSGYRILTINVSVAEPVAGYPDLVSARIIDGVLPVRVPESALEVDNTQGYGLECPASVSAVGDVLARIHQGDTDLHLYPPTDDAR